MRTTKTTRYPLPFERMPALSDETQSCYTHPSGARRAVGSLGWIFALLWAGVLTFLLGLAVTGCSGGYAGQVLGTAQAASNVIDAGQSVSVTLSNAGNLPVSWTLSGPCGSSCGTLQQVTRTGAVFQSASTIGTSMPVTVTAAISGTSSVSTAVVTVNPDPVIVGALPPGVVGVAYQATLHATGGTGTVTLKMVSGTLPPGLTFNSATNVVGGTPTQTGTFNFVVQGTDQASTAFSVTANESITVTAAGTGTGLLTLGGNPGAGTVGSVYAAVLTATGGTAPYTFSVAGGSLPAGLALSGSGLIGGTPTAAGSFTFTAQVKDAAGAMASAPFTISIAAATPTLSIGVGTLPGGTVGVPYSATIGVTGGTAPYTCTLSAGALPAGLSLGAGCAVTGTPTAAGTVTVTVKATDNSSPVQQTSGPVTITISPAPLAITTGALPNGVVGTAYSSTIGVSGGTAPYSCTFTAGTLPAGLTLGANCLVSGTPTTSGTATLTVKATDASNPTLTASGPVTITINPAPLAITTGTLPDGTVGVAYSSTIGVSGGTSPYSCTLVSGALQAGLTLGANCLVSGTPTASGAATLQVKVTDASNPVLSTTGPVTLTIDPAATLTIASPPAGTAGQPYTGTIPVTGGTGPYTCTLKSGTLPQGLTLSSGCVLSGTPVTGGVTPIQVSVADSSKPPITSTGPVTITINNAPLSISTGTLPVGTVGVVYSSTIAVSGGTAPYSCSLVSGTLQAGLTLGANCLVSGTPTASGTVTLQVKATDSSNPVATVTGPVSLTINPVPALTFTGTLPNATLNQAYSQTLTAAGGLPPYTYTLTAGALPAGLALGATTGTIGGTPTAPGASVFTVTATDSEGTPQSVPLPLTLLVVYATTPTDALLKGPYAFLFQGYDDVAAGVLAYQTATIGSFTADGAGAITAGELDANHQASNPTATTVATRQLLGTYTLGTDDRGTLLISTLNGNGTVTNNTYAIAVKAAVAPATTTATGSMIESDSNQLVGTRGSGTFLQQTAATPLSGSYAFGLSGDTPCLPTCTAGLQAGPAATVGQFNAAAGTIATGTADTNLSQLNYPNAAVAGTYGAADADGRVQLSLSNTSIPFAAYPVDYAAYVVDANRVLMMSTDKHSAYILLAGSATLQTQTVFGNTSLTGGYVGYENSPTNPGLAGVALQNVLNLSTATIFRGTANGTGTCTTTNVDVGGATGLVNGLTGQGSGSNVLNALLGTYQSTGNSSCTLSSTTGRAVLNYPVPNTVLTTTLQLLGLSTNPPAPRVAYLTGTDTGYFLETGYAGLGRLEQQAGSPFTPATLDGTFVYGTTPATSLASLNASGVFTANGSGSATSTLDENAGVGTVNVITLGVTAMEPYSLTDATAGRFVLAPSTVIYAINPSRFVLLDTTPASTSPSVVLLY